MILVDGDYSRLPANHAETLRLYIECGYQPGSGFKAILENDLRAVAASIQYLVVPTITRVARAGRESGHTVLVTHVFKTDCI